jgi:S-DNA-T family DNA segregation ATPase FtsK/SpoIIIE
VVVVDGVAALRRELEHPGRGDDHDRWESLLLATPPGVTLLLGDHGASGLSPAVVSRCAHRWLLHLHDAADAGVVGRRAVDVPPPVPGRICDATSGVHVQLLGWPEDLLAVPSVGPLPRIEVPRIEVLPDVVAASCVPRSSVAGHVWTAVLGVEHRTLGPASLEVPAGESVVVVGPPRSGRSSVLDRFRRAWSEARPDGAQVVIRPRPLAPSARAAAVGDAVDGVEAELGRGRPVLLVVDDAELLADPDDRLARLLAASPDDLAVVVACRPDSLRAHGRWTAALRRCRRAVVMSACGDLDADPLGVVLPRHVPIAPRPGLAWIVSEGDMTLAQVASAGPAPA